MEDKVLNRIISAAYNDCGIIEKFRIKRLVSKDPEAKKIFTSYRIAADAVHNLAREECPSVVIAKAVHKNSTTEITQARIFKPALAFAILLIAAVIGVFNLVNKQEKSYTQAEIIKADQQAEQSLALVARILNKTTYTLGQQILPEKVSKPVKKGLTVINHFFIGG